MRPEGAARFLAAICGGAVFIIVGWIVVREILLAAFPMLLGMAALFAMAAVMLGWRNRR